MDISSFIDKNISLWGVLNILFLLIFVVWIFYYPRRLLSKLEESTSKLENMAEEARELVINLTKDKSKIDVSNKIRRFVEFFIIPPVDLDPVGILKKFEHLFNITDHKFKSLVEEIAPYMDTESKANLVMSLKSAVSLYNIAKFIRHHVEMVKQGNWQFAFVLQMSLPMIMKIAKGQLEGTKAMIEGRPIGDGIGPLVATYLIGDATVTEIVEDTILARRDLDGRSVFIVKPKGPGGRLGKVGEAVEILTSHYQIKRIVTIDAAQKLEGEKSGSVAEGIGVAIGGLGMHEKAKIEEVATKKNIPLDAVIIKMSPEEAIKPMSKQIADSIESSLSSVKEIIMREEKGSNIIVVGVGNSCGIGNSIETVKNLEFPEEKKEEEEESKLKRIILPKGKEKKSEE
ncbi:MAG: DUF1512 domain-containing protein [Candidatus Hydrothermarchaeota archaeon]